MPCVVADTSPLFYLAKLDRLDLLRVLYHQVHIPPEVWRETLAGAQTEPSLTAQFFAAQTDGWLVLAAMPSVSADAELSALDAGESEAISLALQLRAMLIIDEKRGRAVATHLGLAVTGTLGVLLEAKRLGAIPALKPELIRLRQETGFRFSAELEQHALQLVGENSP
jgi:predicted nucleic acid-binding protein